MANFLNVNNIKDFKQMCDLETRGLCELMDSRELRICKCGTPYTYDPGVENDPKGCPKCLGREGELVL